MASYTRTSASDFHVRFQFCHAPIGLAKSVRIGARLGANSMRILGVLDSKVQSSLHFKLVRKCNAALQTALFLSFLLNFLLPPRQHAILNLTLFRIKVMQWTNWVFRFSHQICCQMLKVRVVSIAFLSSCIAK